jgi:hypothetical protein
MYQLSTQSLLTPASGPASPRCTPAIIKNANIRKKGAATEQKDLAIAKTHVGLQE